MWVQAICRENLGKGKKTRVMKRSPRFYFALLFAKATAKVMKLIGRKGTSMPGSWAIILCPDFLGRMPRPKYIIGITGTNGKTTTTALVGEIMKHHQEHVFVVGNIGSPYTDAALDTTGRAPMWPPAWPPA